MLAGNSYHIVVFFCACAQSWLLLPSFAAPEFARLLSSYSGRPVGQCSQGKLERVFFHEDCCVVLESSVSPHAVFLKMDVPRHCHTTSHFDDLSFLTVFTNKKDSVFAHSITSFSFFDFNVLSGLFPSKILTHKNFGGEASVVLLA